MSATTAYIKPIGPGFYEVVRLCKWHGAEAVYNNGAQIAAAGTVGPPVRGREHVCDECSEDSRTGSAECPVCEIIHIVPISLLSEAGGLVVCEPCSDKLALEGALT